MTKIRKQGIEYDKDTSYSDKLYDATWTDGINTVMVGGNTWPGDNYKTGWEVTVNGKKLTMNSATDGAKTRATNYEAFSMAKFVITEFMKDNT